MRGLRPTVAVLALLLLGGCADAAQPPAGAGSSAAAPLPGPERSQDPAAVEPPTADLDPAAEGPAADLAGPGASRSGADRTDTKGATGPATAPGSAPEVPVRDATEKPELVERVAPTRLRYDALGVDIPVDAVGVAPDGQMEIPEDAARAGWYRFGPEAGAPSGTAVLAAHAGSYVTPEGPLYDLPDARPGDRVTVENADGTRAVYEVVTVEQTEKTTIDWSAYFTRDGDPRLVLITCGGEWDAQRQSYDDNVTVTARLVDG